MHFQFCQKLGGCCRIACPAPIGFGVGFNGRIGADSSQHIRKLRLVAVVAQLGALPRLDGLVIQIVIDILQAAELGNQRQSGLFPDAGYAGDIVGAVAHQAFYVDQLLGFHAVFFADGSRVHRDGFLVGGKQHGGGIVHQLQAVAVAGGKQRRAALRLARGGQRTQNVVCLPALTADLHKAEVGQQFFQYGHLLRQLVGHTVAGGLVAVVGLVAEGRRAHVPRDGHGVRLVRRQQVQQNILKTEYGVGVAAILGGQQLYAEKRAVDQAVAVQYHKFHSVLLTITIYKISIPQTADLW